MFASLYEETCSMLLFPSEALATFTRYLFTNIRAVYDDVHREVNTVVDTYRFQGATYEDGYLMKSFPLNGLIIDGVKVY